MSDAMFFDYYYGIEAEQFSFYRVPRLLIKDERFKGLSSDAKLLYGLMLDRMSLSMKNKWLDDNDRAYIIYTIEEMMEDLGCARATCIKIIKELDTERGIGLVEKKRRGLGKPDIIYVKNFATLSTKNDEKTSENTDEYTEVQKLNFKKSNNYTSASSEAELQEVQKLNFSKFKNYTSVSSETEPLEVQELNSNYINNNYTDNSYTDMNHHPHLQECDIEATESEEDEGRRNTQICIKTIRNNIEYEHNMRYLPAIDKERFQEIYETICDVVMYKRESVRINGENYPYQAVIDQLLRLNSSHIEFVMERMKEIDTKIINIRSYLITMLYNAPFTMGHYYQQAVIRDGK